MSTYPAADNEPTTLPAGLDAEWRFERDLPCPACAYNLRSLRYPRCPECGLRFRWQRVLRVTCPRCDADLNETDGAACPTCDLALEWDALLREALPSSTDQFEYAPRPLARLPNLWLRGLAPWTLWSNLRIESRPRVGRLGLLFAINAGCLLFALTAIQWVGLGAVPWQLPWTMYIPVLVALAGPPLTFVGLCAFGPTLAAFRVRRDQLSRVVGYATCAFGLLSAIILISAIVSWAMCATLPPHPWTTPGPRYTRSAEWLIWNGTDFWGEFNLLPWRWPGQALYVINIALWTGWLTAPWLWFIALASGLRRYLRLSVFNAIALTVSTQVIIGLIIMLVMLEIANP